MVGFACLDFISGVPLQATALSNLHFLNQIFPYWILTRSISCRDQPCGFSCIHGEQCLCAGVPGVSLSPKRGGTCATQGLELPAWHSVSWRVGRQAVAPGEQEGIRGSAVSHGKAQREQGQQQSSALAPSSPASMGSQRSC